MFDDGKVKIYQKVPVKNDSTRPQIELHLHAEVWYGDINFSIKEYYEAMQAETAVDRRIRIHQDKAISDKFVFEINGEQYEVGRVYHGVKHGIAITDITLGRTTFKYDLT